MKNLDMYDINYNNPYHFNRHNKGDLYKLTIQHSYNNPSLYYGGASSRNYGTIIRDNSKNYHTSSLHNKTEESKNSISKNYNKLKNNLTPIKTEQNITIDNLNNTNLRINKAIFDNNKKITFPKYSNTKSNGNSIKFPGDSNSLIDKRFDSLKYNLAPHHPKEEQKEGQSEYRAEYVPYSPDMQHPIYKKSFGLFPIVENVFRRDKKTIEREVLSTAGTYERSIPSRKENKNSKFKVEEKVNVITKEPTKIPYKSPVRKEEEKKRTISPIEKEIEKRNLSSSPKKNEKKIEIKKKGDSIKINKIEPVKKIEKPRTMEPYKKIVDFPMRAQGVIKVEPIMKVDFPSRIEPIKKDDRVLRYGLTKCHLQDSRIFCHHPPDRCGLLPLWHRWRAVQTDHGI